MSKQTTKTKPPPIQMSMLFGGKPPLAVSCGVGRDSVAMLVGMWQRGIVPDLILFADTGSERQHTYDYIPILNAWLLSVGFPTVTIVKYQVKDFKNWPHYHSLEENLLTNGVLSSSSYGYHDCSSKWKIVPQHKYVCQWQPAIECWAAGGKVRKAIGFDASPHELGRAKGCSTYAVTEEETELYDLWFPLQEWGWDLDRCIREIEAAGLPAPKKSSCYFCIAMKPWEVEELPEFQLKRLVIIEARAMPRLLAHAEKKGWPRGEGVPLVEGVWRRRVKGCRGAIPKPGSITEYIKEKGLLPADEVERLKAQTPKPLMKHGDFEGSWQDWLNRICYPIKNEQIAA